MRKIIYCFDFLSKARGTMHPAEEFDYSDVARDFVEHNLPLWAPCEKDQDEGFRDEKIDALKEQVLVSTSLQLLQILVRAEKFLRDSINNLEFIRNIPEDPNGFESPSPFALGWMQFSKQIAVELSYVFRENSDLINQISLQRINLPAALGEFLKLLSSIKDIFEYRYIGKFENWLWPSFEDDKSFVVCGEYCPYVNLVGELEKIQKLLEKQDDSADRLVRSNYSSACDVMYRAFSNSSKVLVIRVDVGFSKGACLPLFNDRGKQIGDHPMVTIKDFKNHINSFLKLIGSDDLLGRDLMEYIVKIEYGIAKGLHAHVLLLVNGHKRQQDITIAKIIGDAWVKLVGSDIGVYWNCNARKKDYSQLGLGMVCRTDAEVIEVIKSKILRYLVKYDVILSISKFKGTRKFRTSLKKRRSVRIVR